MQTTAAEIAAAQAKGDQASVDKLEPQRQQAAAGALDLLQLALKLKDHTTSIEAANSARYYLCYLNWALGNYYDAAVLGEFLADHFPESVPGRKGAEIAMAAWVQLYGEADAADRQFELAQIQKIADLIFRRWPDQEEAEQAALTLVNFAAAAGEVDKAVAYLERISADSPRRRRPRCGPARRCGRPI